MSHKSSMHEGGESYSGTVLTKQPNQSGIPPAEVVEGRPLTKENTSEPNSCRTPCRESGRSGLAQLPRFSGRNVGNKVLARFLVTICRLLSPRNRFGTASRTRPT